jgi:hypothetical protein
MPELTGSGHECNQESEGDANFFHGGISFLFGVGLESNGAWVILPQAEAVDYNPSHKFLNRIRQQPRCSIPKKFSA